jgi:hypothetical protein
MPAKPAKYGIRARPRARYQAAEDFAKRVSVKSRS